MGTMVFTMGPFTVEIQTTISVFGVMTPGSGSGAGSQTRSPGL